MQKVKNTIRFAMAHPREILLYPAILYVTAFVLGLIFFWGDGGFVHIDEMHWVERAHILIATHGIPAYHWHHTQFYNYFLAICLYLFGENYFLIHLVQNFFIASFPVIVYFTLRYCFSEKKVTRPETGDSFQETVRNGSLTIPLFGGFLAATSFFSTYITANFLIENLTFVFFALSLHLWHRYYQEAGTKADMRNLVCAALCTGITFNFKETSVMLYALPLLYILWQTRKTLTFRKIIVLLFIFGLSVSPFILVLFFTDFFFARYYLGSTFPSSMNLVETLYGNFLILTDLNLSYLPFLTVIAIIGGLYLIIIKFRRRSDKNRASRLDTLAFFSLLSIIGYYIFLIFRPSNQFLVMLLPPLTILAAWFGMQIFQFTKSIIANKESDLDRDRKCTKHFQILFVIIIGSQVAYTGYAMFVTKPVIYQSYDVWTQISTRVGNNATYLTIALGDIYFSNAYGPSMWHASYRRHGWLSYAEEDLRELNATLFHEWNIKNIVVSDGEISNDYVKNLILSNGTLLGKWSYQFIETQKNPFTPSNYTVYLFYIS